MTANDFVPLTITPRLRQYPGIPDSWNAAQHRVAQDILDTLAMAGFDEEVLGEPDPAADIEDFWEDAIRLDAAIKTVAKRGGEFIEITKNVAQLDRARRANRRLGMLAQHEQPRGRYGTDSHLFNPAFLQYAGRPIDPVIFGESGRDTDEIELTQYCVNRAIQGWKAVVVKSTRAKEGIWLLKLSKNKTREDYLQDLMDIEYFPVMSIEGATGRLVAQPFVDMSWEMRHFVVDGNVISSAGCIEEFTPISRWNQTNPQHPHHDATSMLRITRGAFGLAEPSVLAPMPQLKAQQQAFAQLVADHPDTPATVVIDTAWCEDTQQYIVVEFNDLPNAGFYANDAWAITDALADADNKGYDPNAETEQDFIDKLVANAQKADET